jgi:catechol 2,3-dioxygenase-like lactoylglutathione lyase family enzyme
VIGHVFAGLPASDIRASSVWYERLMGRPPDLVPHESEVAWRLTDTGWIYVVEDPGRAGNALVTVLVEDLETHVAELASRGLATPAMETIAGVGRKAAIADPDGNLITFAEAG